MWISSRTAPEHHPADRCTSLSDPRLDCCMVRDVQYPVLLPTNKCRRFSAPRLVRLPGANRSAPRASSGRQVRDARYPQPHPTDGCKRFSASSRGAFNTPRIVRSTGAADSPASSFVRPACARRLTPRILSDPQVRDVRHPEPQASGRCKSP